MECCSVAYKDNSIIFYNDVSPWTKRNPLTKGHVLTISLQKSLEEQVNEKFDEYIEKITSEN